MNAAFSKISKEFGGTRTLAVAHEMGHFVFKTGDIDVKHEAGMQKAMKNIVKNENPIMEELGSPPRCAYYSNSKKCEPGF